MCILYTVSDLVAVDFIPDAKLRERTSPVAYARTDTELAVDALQWSLDSMTVCRVPEGFGMIAQLQLPTLRARHRSTLQPELVA